VAAEVHVFQLNDVLQLLDLLLLGVDQPSQRLIVLLFLSQLLQQLLLNVCHLVVYFLELPYLCFQISYPLVGYA